MSVPAAAGGEPFDQQGIKNILVQLYSQPANVVESHTLEVKGWCRDECQLAEKVSEAAACLANASGGTIIIGVEEEGNKLLRFSKCRYPNVTKEWITKRIQDLTIPPVEQTTYDISTLLQEVTGIYEANAFAVSVPRSKRVSGHLTTKGISKIRSGKECRPYYSIEDDRTKAPVPALSMSDLSVESIQWAIDQHKNKFHVPATHWAGVADFVEHIGAVERYIPDGEILPNYRITLAGLLLFGKQSAIAKHFPSFETVVISSQEPLHLRKNIVETFRELCASRNALLPCLCPTVDMQTLRELLVNAYIHRSYRINGPIIVRLSESAVEIESPGELPTGLNADNLIHCVPIYRNFSLAECGRYLGLCDKIGQGIDLVYSAVLSSGFGFPSFESKDDHFIAHIPLGATPEFREFVRKRSQSLTQLEEIMVLRLLWDKGQASVFELSSLMQRGTEVGQVVLDRMFRKSMIEAVDGTLKVWRLTSVLRNDIQTIFQSDQIGLDLFGESL